MKNVQKTKEKKRKIKQKVIDKSKKAQVLVVAQEIRLARLLSGNETKTRDKVLKTLKKWLSNCFNKEYEFKEDDFVRVWKGLFYAVWMSDKPLIQEDLCESIASILDQFPSDQIKHAMLMVKAGFKVLATEWYGIDHHRMDKFLMMVRRYLRGSLRCLSRCKWSLESCELYTRMLSNSDGLLALKTPHYARNATSMLMHFIDCYLEELAKVSNGVLPDDSLVELLKPFCGYMCGGETPTLCAATRRLLTELVRQSDKGLEYLEAKRAWEKMGCPEGGPEALELVEDDDDGEEIQENGYDWSDDDDRTDIPLDPRAGRVDVLLPTLPVPATKIALLLKELLANASSKAHKRVKICLQRFEKLAQDEYPLRIELADEDESPPLVISKAKSAQALQALEKQLVSSSDELALRGLSRKHRKRLLAKTRAGLSIVDDVEKINQSLSKTSTNGDWQVEPTEPKSKKPKLEDSSNKENQRKKVKKLKDNLQNNKHKKHNGDIPKKQIRDRKEKVIKENNSQTKEKVSKEKILHKKETVSKERVLERKNSVSNDKQNTYKEKSTYSKLPKDMNTIIEQKISESKNKKVDSETNKHILTKVVNNKKLQKTEKINGVEGKSGKKSKIEKPKRPSLTLNKVKIFQKSTTSKSKLDVESYDSPKRVKFVLKKNSMQGTMDYYKSVRLSPSIPFDSTKQPNKTNLKPSTPSPINPFFKKKLKMKK